MDLTHGPPETFDLLRRLAVALAIGLLFGLERGWKFRGEAEGERTAGLRTYALSGLLGGTAAALSMVAGPIVLGAVLLAHAGAMAAFAWLEAQKEGNLSVTSVVAAILTFSLGALAVVGNLQAAVAATVSATILLALKQPLHRWLERIAWVEIRAVLILLAMTFLLLPVLPDRAVDPWGALNPWQIWLLAIIIAGISFAGYVLVKLLGDEAGITLAAAAGGLASSTATTATLARLARGQPESSQLIAGGILLSGTVMVARIVLIAGALNPRLAFVLAPSFGAAGLVLLGASAALLWRTTKTSETRPRLAIENPLDLAATLKIAAVIAVVILASRLAVTHFGSAGVMVLAAFSGLADVDAITLSMARMAPGELSYAVATLAVGVCAAVNTAVKAVMTFSLGNAATGRLVAGASAAAVAAGALVLLAF
jgi:uncharacterized membrane protein (DUF4010 family)